MLHDAADSGSYAQRVVAEDASHQVGVEGWGVRLKKRSTFDDRGYVRDGRDGVEGGDIEAAFVLGEPTLSANLGRDGRRVRITQQTS
jgi:hypothetical protein